MNLDLLRAGCLAIVVAIGLLTISNSNAAEDKCKEIAALLGGASDSLETPSAGKPEATDICNLIAGIKDKEPETANQVLAKFLERDSGFAFLQDIDFKIKAFDVKEGESVLGFSYDYEKINTLDDYKYSATDDVTMGWAWKFSAKGNVAFDSAANPRDFLDTRIAFSGFRNKGGITAVSDKDVFAQLNELESKLALIKDEDELAKEDLFKPFRQNLGLQTYIDLNLNAGLESNQTFSQRQWTYGPQIALDVKSYDTSSWTSRANIFDYPFALLRMFTGYDKDKKFSVYGWTYPSVILGLDQVEPEENDARRTLGEEVRFDRYRAEVYFRTPIAYVKGSEIFFNFDYRILRERDPPASIEAAGLNEFSYRVLSITSDKGVYVSYSKGKLPFDLVDQQVYELGWKFHF